MNMIKRICLALILITSTASLNAQCVGRFINPITDVCWSCIFPISIVGVSMGEGLDTDNPRTPLCVCEQIFPGVNRVGIPVSFWEPVRMVDVTRTPYCMVNLGGKVMGPDTGVKGRGSVGKRNGSGMKHSFYQVHYYVYPLLYWLEVLTDFVCMEKGSPDVVYITELDPLWNDDELTFIINPEAVLFGNPIAQAACAADCALASAGFGLDLLFWCAGCQGSMYPFTGNVSAHSGGVQASVLITERFLAKLHREGLLHGYVGVQGLCQKYPMPIIRKSQYKIQMTYPVPDLVRGCHPIGQSDLLWSTGHHFPIKGEDFGYLIWRKRNCCIL